MVRRLGGWKKPCQLYAWRGVRAVSNTKPALAMPWEGRLYAWCGERAVSNTKPALDREGRRIMIGNGGEWASYPRPPVRWAYALCTSTESVTKKESDPFGKNLPILPRMKSEDKSDQKLWFIKIIMDVKGCLGTKTRVQRSNRSRRPWIFQHREWKLIIILKRGRRLTKVFDNRLVSSTIFHHQDCHHTVLLDAKGFIRGANLVCTQSLQLKVRARRGALE